MAIFGISTIIFAVIVVILSGLKVVKEYERGVKFTLGEFSGLKDKNGQNIYEGDIILYKLNFETENEEDYICKIVFELGAYIMINNIFDDGYELLFGNDFHDSICPNIEIIGNIHQNKELLK